MQKVLRKRILRDLKENIFRYLALGVIIALCMYLIINVIGTAETIMQGTGAVGKENKVEDGQFSLLFPLNEEEIEIISEKGVTLEKHFYLDFTMEDESVLRVFENREKIDLYIVVEGRAAESDKEVALERRYCDEHDIEIGDGIVIGGRELTVVGIGCTPDYESVLKELTDACVDSVQFGTAFVTDGLYDVLLSEKKSVKAEQYVYSYILNDAITDEDLRDILEDVSTESENEYLEYVSSNLKSLVTADDNPRIGAAADDQVINKKTGIVAGVIVIILFAYVIAVFVVYGIEKEITTIGALYSLGVKKKELLKHYLFLPVIVTFLASVTGSIWGFNAIGGSTMAGDCYGYFSIPDIEPVLPAYLVVYGLVMPPVMAALINCFVISKKLNRPALAMLRNEKNVKKTKYVKLGKLGYVGTFRIRQMMRETRTSLTVLGGMFVSLLILMLGLDCYAMCKKISVENKEDTKFEYMYTLKYPESVVPEGAYKALSKMVKKENLGYNLDVTILGITKDNPFFDVSLTDSKSEIVISSAMAQKFDLKTGDVFTVYDEGEKMYYAFTVGDILDYSVGLYIFMDIDAMCDMFDVGEDYYNTVFSDRELNIEQELIYGVTTKADIETASDVFIDKMWGMIYILTAFSVVIFAMVMYLMIKVMIDRSAFNISMIKVFGYRTGEIKKLYLNGNFYVIAIGALVGIPAAKIVIDMVYPFMVANVSSGMDTEFSLGMYGIIYVGVILIYLVINQLLVRRLNKVNLAEVLKNRE